MYIRSRGVRVRTNALIFINFCLLLYTLFAIYINLIYGVKFAPDQARNWIVAAITTVCLDSAVQQPAMLIFKAVKLTGLTGVVVGNIADTFLSS